MFLTHFAGSQSLKIEHFVRLDPLSFRPTKNTPPPPQLHLKNRSESPPNKHRRASIRNARRCQGEGVSLRFRILRVSESRMIQSRLVQPRRKVQLGPRASP